MFDFSRNVAPNPVLPAEGLAINYYPVKGSLDQSVELRQPVFRGSHSNFLTHTHRHCFSVLLPFHGFSSQRSAGVLFCSPLLRRCPMLLQAYYSLCICLVFPCWFPKNTYTDSLSCTRTRMYREPKPTVLTRLTRGGHTRLYVILRGSWAPNTQNYRKALKTPTQIHTHSLPPSNLVMIN